MKICRYDNNRIGVVKNKQLYDASSALDTLPELRWPVPLGDHFVANLEKLIPELEQAAAKSEPVDIDSVRLLSPVANPSKIIAAPVNYEKHLAEAQTDRDLHQDTQIKPIAKAGLFLKANSSLVGPGEGVAVRFINTRVDHEVELAVIIGKRTDRISRDKAIDSVAAYAIGLDMSVRGTEDRSFRKSADGYTVLGPWLVTADEIPEPGNLDLQIKINDELRQQSNTRYLIYDIPRLIEFASSFYTLYPGDIILTGTPEGVGPVKDGDIMLAEIAQIGSMRIAVRQD